MAFVQRAELERTNEDSGSWQWTLNSILPLSRPNDDGDEQKTNERTNERANEPTSQRTNKRTDAPGRPTDGRTGEKKSSPALTLG